MRVIPPGGPYFKWPWEEVRKVSIATQTINMAMDPETPSANNRGTVLEAVTKDQLNTGLKGQLRYRISERTLYAYLFGVRLPIVHVMGYFVSILRERIANFEAPAHKPAPDGPLKPDVAAATMGISINDLRKNLSDINDHMARECVSSEARYGITLDASLITGIDPPPEVESALAAINTAYNQVSSDVSLAQASADQKIVQSRRAVEIETLKAQAEVEPLMAMAGQLAELKKSGPQVLAAYLRNVRLKLFSECRRVILGSPIMNNFAVAAVASFFGSFVVVPLLLGLARVFGLYTIVDERQCKVYVLFGKVIGELEEPGLHFLLPKLGLSALIVNIFGNCYELNMQLDQAYLRSQPVNSEEGAPMGIGIWYEMFISNPVSFLFKNADPRGSLAANVGNSTVRCLSNMKLADMLENRHSMSQTVRGQVSPQSEQWGYKLGSVYIRKVHFRDVGMIKQIEEKVVNRLRQVTSAIKQDGANQVSIITSTAERQAAIEFAKAAAMRPEIVGAALQQIAQDSEIADSMFEILETQNIVNAKAEITLMPRHQKLLGEILAVQGDGRTAGNSAIMIDSLDFFTTETQRHRE